MRRMLAAAVALGPLVIAAGAHAQTVISTDRTTPIATATADGGAPDDVQIAEDGSITLDSGVAVTLNSDNDVTVDGDILMEESADGSTAILAIGGNTGSITNSGSIRVTDDQETEEDTDNDGDPDGPFATGSDRHGIHVQGPGALTGDILTARGSSIEVEGEDSYGIRIESDLDGDLTNFGVLTVNGSRGYGVRTTGDITGDVRLGGSIGARGEDSVGASIEGDIGGVLIVDGAITTSGFRSTVPPTDQGILDGLDPDDLLIGGPALRIAADVAGGVHLQAAQLDEDEDEDDEDGDGIIDTEETTASINSFGSAPAVEIGSATRSVTLGVVGAGELAYGFINVGEIRAEGVYEGVSATGVQVGVDPGQATIIDGGFLNDTAITAASNEADVTGVRFGAGAVTPTFITDGLLQVDMGGDGAFNAIALDIEAGADVASFENRSVANAAVFGEAGDAIIVRDQSGTLASVTNSGTMRARVVGTADEDGNVDPITGNAIAIDVSANTTGVTVRQYGELFDPTADFPDADEDGVADFDEPVMIGDILFGSGADLLDAENGTIEGDISFGAGADTLLVTGGAVVRGALADSDGLLDVTVMDGVLDARQTTQLDVTELTVGADADLIFTIDPEAGTSGGFNVSGTATFADGAGLGVRFNSLLAAPDRFIVVDAATLDFGDIDLSSIEANSPYLFIVDAGADELAGQVYVDIRRRTADEASFISVEEAAYDAIYGALGTDEELRNAFLAQNDRAGFINLYQQMLPDHSGGPLMSLASGLDAVTRALAGRGAPPAQGETSAWLQEINFYAEKDQDQAYGFESEGFGLAGGIERGMSFGTLGVSAAFTSSDLEDPEAQAEELLSARLFELGVYWRAQVSNWSLWGRAAGGYATFDATRQLVGAGLARRNESSWSGYTASAALGASYEHQMGRYSIRPEGHVQYFMLTEDARQESGGGDGFDLAIEERDGHLLTATAAVAFGAAFGENQWFRPEVRVGWRQNISFDAGDTTARFLSGGAPFTLAADTIEGGGPLVGFRLNFGNELGALSVEGDAEMIDDYVRYSLLLRATFRF